MISSSPVWSYDTGEGVVNNASPVIADGMMYVIAGGNSIAALDPASGREIWKTRADHRQDAWILLLAQC